MMGKPGKIKMRYCYNYMGKLVNKMRYRYMMLYAITLRIQVSSQEVFGVDLGG